MILKVPQKCSSLCPNINWMQASYLIKHLGTRSYSKAFSRIPSDSYVTLYPNNLLQLCTRHIINCKRHKSHQPFKGKFGGDGLSKLIYAKKFLAGGMVEPKLPWKVYTGHPLSKKSGLGNIGGHTTTRRLRVLDQVYFDAISDLLTSGEVGSRLTGRGLVITKVRVQEGLIGMKVFWTETAGDLSKQIAVPEGENRCKQTKEGYEEELSTEDVLKWAAPILRQELAEMRLVGCTVPHINFKPDISLHNSLLVERILVNVREELQEADARADKDKEAHKLLLEQQQRLQVPESIFAPDFVYQPVIYDASNLPQYSSKKPLSRFTPFAPLGKGLRVGPKTPIDDSTETDAFLKDNSADDETSSRTSANTEPKSVSATKAPIRLRKSKPQHGIMLQNNIYGICRDRIMEKIVACIGRMKEYKSVTNADLNFPLALTLRLPSGEPQTDQPTIEPFKSKSSIQSWAHNYSRKTFHNSDERSLLMNKISAEEKSYLNEQEDYKYDEFEEELKRVADEEDYWIEPEEKF